MVEDLQGERAEIAMIMIMEMEQSQILDPEIVSGINSPTGSSSSNTITISGTTAVLAHISALQSYLEALPISSFPHPSIQHKTIYSLCYHTTSDSPTLSSSTPALSKKAVDTSKLASIVFYQ